ncbi:hypothetical protein LZL87_000854 [Fusarium oxysporum]|nr:hypothetical protein LZL87_000854 [Fusarium oxysporum]
MSFKAFCCCRCTRRSRVGIDRPSEEALINGMQPEDLERGEPQQENDLQNNEVQHDVDQHDSDPQQDSDPESHSDATIPFPPYDDDPSSEDVSQTNDTQNATGSRRDDETQQDDTQSENDLEQDNDAQSGDNRSDGDEHDNTQRDDVPQANDIPTNGTQDGTDSQRDHSCAQHNGPRPAADLRQDHETQHNGPQGLSDLQLYLLDLARARDLPPRPIHHYPLPPPLPPCHRAYSNTLTTSQSQYQQQGYGQPSMSNFHQQSQPSQYQGGRNENSGPEAVSDSPQTSGGAGERQTTDNAISPLNVSVIVHAANSINPGLALSLIKALAKQKEAAGKPTHFIHTSGPSAFYANSGWPRTIGKDTDAVFETKEFADSYPIRKSLQAVHISDLTALYCRIIHAALNHEEIPSGKDRYCFAVAHEMNMWEFQDHLSAAMKARGLVSSDKPEVYPGDEFAAEAIDVPVEFLGALCKSGGDFTATRPQSIGWKPEWDRERFLKNIDAEIGDVLELGKSKSSLIDSLFAGVGRSR